ARGRPAVHGHLRRPRTDQRSRPARRAPPGVRAPASRRPARRRRPCGPRTPGEPDMTRTPTPPPDPADWRPEQMPGPLSMTAPLDRAALDAPNASQRALRPGPVTSTAHLSGLRAYSRGAALRGIEAIRLTHRSAEGMRRPLAELELHGHITR